MQPTVAVLGTRYPDLSLESEVLGPDITIVRGDGHDANAIVDSARQAEVIIAGSAPRFTEDVIARLDRCKGIIRAGIGVDSVDLEAASSAGLWVVNVPDYGTESVALHAVTLALAGVRRLIEANSLVRSGNWGIDPISPIHMPSAMTAGVVGYGRVGRRVTELLTTLGFARTLAHDPHASIHDQGVERADLDRLLSISDLVTLHAPATETGKPRLIAERELSLMKEGSILINTARGSLVDPEALARALGRGAPRIAALDVFDDEPPDLREFADVLDRLILTPHMAWYSEETQRTLRVESAMQARLLLDGREPTTAVVKPGGVRA